MLCLSNQFANTLQGSTGEGNHTGVVEEKQVMERSSFLSARQLAHRRGEYGFDEPIWPFLLGLISVIFLLMGCVSVSLFAFSLLGVLCFFLSLVHFLIASSYVYTTRRGKFQVWAEILLGLDLRGDEQVLDLGCRRGAVLFMAANLLPRGKATGIDIWRTKEQSHNALFSTLHNAKLEGVDERVTVQTADMQHLPFSDGSFDLVLSSLAIHNIRDPEGYERAINEAVRVLKAGGRLVVADIHETQRYAEHLQALGMEDVGHYRLDWRFRYGTPWTAARLVKAQKAT